MAIRPEADELIVFLNSLVALDRAGMQALIGVRVPCNGCLGAHPTVQVASRGDGGIFLEIPEGEYRVGLLGVLNGFMGAFDTGPRKGWGAIAARVEADGTLICFERTVEFPSAI